MLKRFFSFSLVIFFSFNFFKFLEISKFDDIMGFPKEEISRLGNSRSSVSLGRNNSSFSLENKFSNTNTFYVWGDNEFGQLGTNSSKDFEWKPTPLDINENGIIGDEKIVSFDFSDNHSGAVLDNGDGTTTLYTWGNNSSGQLGDGTQNNKSKPTPIDLDGDGIIGNEKIVDVKLGDYHSSAVLDNGNGTNTLYTWGRNDDGQLGIFSSMDIEKIPTPIDIDGDGVIGNEKILEVNLGDSHSLLLIDNDDGTQSAFSFGENIYGQLGIPGTGAYEDTPQEIDLNGDGTPGNEKIIKISAGFRSSAAILDNGNGTTIAYTWGLNNHGQLGDGTKEDKNKPTPIDLDGDGIKGNENAIDIELSKWFHGVAILDNGDDTNTLCAWGANNTYQLGINDFDPSTADQTTSVEVDIDRDGTPGNEKIIDISLGGYHSSALLEDKNDSDKVNLYTWGNNYYGQLGVAELLPTNVSGDPILTGLGEVFDFTIVEKDQSSFTFTFDTILELTENEKSNLFLIDKNNKNYYPSYDSSDDKFRINDLEVGTSYYFSFIKVGDIYYNIYGFLNPLIDYRLDGINRWTSTSKTAEIYFDISSSLDAVFLPWSSIEVIITLCETSLNHAETLDLRLGM